MNIDTQTWFHPEDPRCKQPYGAAPNHAAVTFTLRPLRRDGFVRGELIARWEFSGDAVTVTPMPWTGLDGDRDQFSCQLELGDYTGLVWYALRLVRWDGQEETTGEYQLTVYDSAEQVPSWFGEGVTYQIFPDRFHRLSVPDPAGMLGGRWVHQSWSEEPEYRPDHNGEIRNRDFFGGSLAGVEQKLPYLQSLGVETIYFCPIFEAPENHRYGTADYETIDPMLGTREDFTRLCKKAHKLGMHIMLDGVFNHTGFISRYFNTEGHYGVPGAYESPHSPYRDWFYFEQWPNKYHSWWGIYSLPTTNKECGAWLEYITGENGVIRSWLRAGADGWRLDVADELPDFVVHAIHEAARAEDPNAVIIGEVWEDASTKIAYDVRRRHVLGGHCDGVMNYPVKNALLAYLLGGGAEELQLAIETQREHYPRWAFYSGMNSLGTHDTQRVLTLLGTGSDGKDHDRDWRHYKRLSPQERALGVARLKLGALLLYALPGSPTVYYGDEAGLEGYEDPFNRRPFPWGGEDRELLRWFTALGRCRKTLPALRQGELEWLCARGHSVALLRTLDKQQVVAAANTGDHTALIPLPDGSQLRLGPMTARLLVREREGFVSIV